MNEDKIHAYSLPNRGFIIPQNLRPSTMLVDDISKPMPKYMGPDEVDNTINYGWPEKVVAQHRGFGKSSYRVGLDTSGTVIGDPVFIDDAFSDSLDALKYSLQARSAVFYKEEILRRDSEFNPGRISRFGYSNIIDSIQSHSHTEHMIFMARLQQKSFSPYPVGSEENPLLVHHSLVCYAKQKMKLHVRTINSDRLGGIDENP